MNDTIPNNMETEPAGILGMVSAAVFSVLTLIIAFGFDLSGDQVAAIMGVVGTIGVLVMAFVTRSKVYSPATHAADVQRAIEVGMGIPQS